MAKKNLYEDLIRYYEFQIGKLPHREKFKEALETTFPAKDLQIFFQLPYLGFIDDQKFRKKLEKAGISAAEFESALSRMIPR